MKILKRQKWTRQTCSNEEGTALYNLFGFEVKIDENGKTFSVFSEEKKVSFTSINLLQDRAAIAGDIARMFNSYGKNKGVLLARKEMRQALGLESVGFNEAKITTH